MCWTEEKTVPTVDRRRFLRPLPTRGIREGADPGFLGPGFRTQSLDPCTRKPRDFEVLNCPTSWLWKEPVRPLGSGKKKINLRDQVLNLRDQVPNLRAQVLDLRDQVLNIRDHVLNLRDQARKRGGGGWFRRIRFPGIREKGRRGQ